MNRTLVTDVCTVLLASGLERGWWHHTVMYQTFLQNVKHSPLPRSSPHPMMFGPKPDVSSSQESTSRLGCIVGSTSDRTASLMLRVVANLLFSLIILLISTAFWYGVLAVGRKLWEQLPRTATTNCGLERLGTTAFWYGGRGNFRPDEKCGLEQRDLCLERPSNNWVSQLREKDLGLSDSL
jgi:hypothetical protein